MRVGRQLPFAKPEVIFEPNPHVATGQNCSSHIRHLITAKAERRPVPISGHSVHHRKEGVHVIRRAPRHTHAQLNEGLTVERAFLHQLLSEPKVPRIKGFDFRLHAEFGHHAAHRPQHAGGVGHDVISFGKVHRATVQRANLWKTLFDMNHPFGRADHIGCGGIHWERCFGRSENDITPHPCGQVQHHIDLSIADPFSQFPIERRVTRRLTRFRITHVTMNNRGARFCCINRAIRDLLWTAGNMRRPVLRRARPCNSTGDKDLFIHCQRHRELLTYIGTGQLAQSRCSIPTTYL